MKLKAVCESKSIKSKGIGVTYRITGGDVYKGTPPSGKLELYLSQEQADEIYVGSACDVEINNPRPVSNNPTHTPIKTERNKSEHRIEDTVRPLSQDVEELADEIIEMADLDPNKTIIFVIDGEQITQSVKIGCSMQSAKARALQQTCITEIVNDEWEVRDKYRMIITPTWQIPKSMEDRTTYFITRKPAHGVLK
jgi:hypothetical protein